MLSDTQSESVKKTYRTKGGYESNEAASENDRDHGMGSKSDRRDDDRDGCGNRRGLNDDEWEAKQRESAMAWNRERQENDKDQDYGDAESKEDIHEYGRHR